MTTQRVWRGAMALAILGMVSGGTTVAWGGSQGGLSLYVEAQKGYQTMAPVTKSAEEWKTQLTPEQFRLMRQGGTESPFSGAFWNNHASGIYHCAGCGTDLFSSNAKFDAGNGWPNFWQPISGANLKINGNEILCGRCGAHLGFIYNDGPKPSGRRYTVNSGGLTFTAK
ncbi:MAG: peptide-methionine (R)-S-oxide reductase MsrB [candidate division FCPU426 bacterium]